MKTIKTLSLSLSLSALVASSLFVATSCGSNPNKLIIYGDDTIRTHVGEYCEKDYKAIDTNGNVVECSWTIENVSDEHYANSFHITKTHDVTTAQLYWGSFTFQEQTNLDLTIKCESRDSTKTKTIHFDVLPTNEYINIFGPLNLSGTSDVAGQTVYSAVDNNGHKINGIWSIQMIDLEKPSWLTIDSYGTLNWSNTCVTGSWTFTIQCDVHINGKFVLGISQEITLQINDYVPPLPTSITIYGPNILNGWIDLDGSATYEAFDNNGHQIEDGTWTIENKVGNANLTIVDGLLQWNVTSTGFTTFQIKCISGTLEYTTEQITLDIKTSPYPPYHNVMPTDCLIITNGGKSCDGIKGDVELNRYNEIDVPEGIETLGGFNGRIPSGLGYTIKLPNSLTELRDASFTHCTGIRKIYFGSGLIKIGVSAFYGCNNLIGALTIPNSVTTIKNSAFMECSGFTNLSLGNSVEFIGELAFARCAGFSGELVIPNSVTTIDRGAFSECAGFNGKLVIPSSVASCRYQAFVGCSGFNNLTFDNFNAEPQWGWQEIDVFEDWNSSGGTVSVTGSYTATWTATSALAFAMTKGLSSNWIIA